MAAHLAGDLLNIGLKAVPIPYLDASFSILTALYASIQHVRGIRTQMTALATSVEVLLCHLNVELQGMEHLDESIEILLKDFTSLLNDISKTAQEYSKHSYRKIFFTWTDTQNLIDQHQRKITQLSANFQMRLQILMHNDMRKFEQLRQLDMRKLEEARQLDMRKFEEVRQSDARYPGSKGTGWSPEKFPNNPPSYPYSDEPAPMAASESKLPLNWSYSAHRPLYSPVHGAYASYPPAAPSSAPKRRNAYDNDNQPGPYNLFGHNVLQMPAPHHYSY